MDQVFDEAVYECSYLEHTMQFNAVGLGSQQTYLLYTYNTINIA